MLRESNTTANWIDRALILNSSININNQLNQPEEMSRIAKSLSKSQSQFTSISNYLTHCRSNGSNTASTVFLGTLYELHVRDELQRLMGPMESLEYYGGAYDNGRDLAGKWDISPYYDITNTEVKQMKVRGRLVKPMVLRKNTKMDVLVQCKNFSSKIQAKEIRELSGIFNFNVRSRDKYTTLAIMASSSMLTTQAQKQMDQSDIPLVFVQIPKLLRISLQHDPYDINSYTRSEQRGIYMNPLTYALWQGTSLLHLSHKIA